MAQQVPESLRIAQADVLARARAMGALREARLAAPKGGGPSLDPRPIRGMSYATQWRKTQNKQAKMVRVWE